MSIAGIWTQEEVSLLGTASDSEVATKLGRTYEAVRTKRRTLRRGGLARLGPLQQPEVCSVTVASLLGLLEKQGHKCALTGRALTPENCCLDHINPRSMGGEHVIENVHLVVPEANRAKGTMSMDEFIGLCREVVAWADRAPVCGSL